MRFCELCEKEVISCKDGSRLGFVSDLVFSCATGCIEAIVVPIGGKVMGVFGKEEEIVITWEEIERMGEDIILVNACMPPCTPKKKKSFF